MSGQYQYWNNGLDNKYTSFFINLVDDFNENGVWFGSAGRTGVVDDQVSGYNLATIQANYLRNIHGANSLQIQLNNNRPTGVTTNQLTTLLSFY